MNWKPILASFACIATTVAITTQCSLLSGATPKNTASTPVLRTHNQVQGIPSNIPSGAQTSYRGITTTGPFIAMTFDDGPHPSLTPRLLQILRERNIKATFYVVGNRCRAFAGVMRKIAADGHDFGNHTWTHPLAPSRWAEGPLRNELEKTHDVIVETGGLAPKTYRPPGGSVSPEQKNWIFNDFGYPTILWAVDPNDWRDRNAALVTNRILNQTRAGNIVLAHDIHRTTIDAMPGTLDGLLAKGFRFVTVPQLISIGEGKLAENGAPKEPTKVISFSFGPGSY
jgi:peptidoglycan/xylan/chitin deacetylase (PgdA/CDA1 family)